jgi:excisionase family DNA binding protein
MDDQPLWDDERTGEFLDVPTGTLANWRYQRRGPRFVKVGRHVRYRRSDVEAWLEKNARESTAAP